MFFYVTLVGSFALNILIKTLSLIFAISFVSATHASASLSLESFTPPNNKTGVELDAHIVLNFTETVYVGSGSIDIYDSGGTLFESISELNAFSPNYGKQITIEPSSNFACGTSYYIKIPSAYGESIIRNSDNEYLLITDNSTMTFTTLDCATNSTPAATFESLATEINTEIVKVVDTSLTNLGVTVKKISSTSRGRFIAKKPQATVGGSTTTQAFSAALPEISEVFDSFDNMLVASTQKTRSITSFLQNSADECKALDQQAYAIDCLGSSLEELANELPASGDYAKVKFAFAKGAEQLKQLTINNAADSLPSVTFDNVARPLTATKSSDEDIAYLNEEITKIYDEIATTLLRSDESSESRKLAYKQISTVFMSNKVLLRSSSEESSNDPGYSGYLHASRGVINSKVSFTKSSKSHTSEYTTYTSSDIFLNRNKDDSRSLGAGTQVQFEKMLNDKMMLGYFVGGSIGLNNKSGTLRSKSQTLGVSVGSYFVRELEGNMLLDGYATFMVTQNDLNFTTDLMTAKGLYYSQAGAVGLNLTGFIPLGSMELRPRTSLSLVRSLGKTINFDVTVGSASSTEQATHGSVSQVNLGLSPELRMPLPVWGFNRDQSNYLNENSVGTITPNITCQQLIKTTTTRHCGQGIALGIDTMSADGLTNITAGTSFDHMNGQTSAGIQLKIRTKW
jgi:hypothetical protein